MMKTILFNVEMTMAILEGRKVQTRRVIKSVKDAGVEFKRFELKGNSFNGFWRDEDRAKKFSQPLRDFVKQEAKYQKDETIWVREPAKIEDFSGGKIWYRYKADNERGIIPFPCRLYVERTKGFKVDYPMWLINKKGVPNGCIKEMARIFLKVTDVRVERLQDISAEDIRKEGVVVPYEPMEFSDGGQKYYGNKHTVFSAWIKLWNSTAPKGYKWEDNPYVFVYEFERVENNA